MNCRHCLNELEHSFINLGTSPPSNAFVSLNDLKSFEKWYPLNVLVCDKCWLVQTEDFVQANEMFSPDYAYFSSFSTSFLMHCESYVNNMVERFKLNSNSLVVEVAANDGYLLQYFIKLGISCYGIEPTHNTAEAAREKGIEIIESFFGLKTAKQLKLNKNKADLMCANNVLAHVPDINDFVSGFTLLLKPNGVVTFENPHLLNLIKEKQFDTIYHEHYSYLSVTSVKKIFLTNGLTLFDVEQLPTHGGSLRYFGQKTDSGKHPISPSVHKLISIENAAGLNDLKFYKGFQLEAEIIKREFVEFLINAKKNGKKISGYGAAAKGNTILNYSGIRSDLISFIVDLNPAKQNKYTPGSRIPIVNENFLIKEKPDYIVIFPWNLKSEIIDQLNYVRDWGCEFVILIPELKII
jgi:SAM-dependent methyltransferase